MRQHIDYPAAGREILEACNRWEDVPKEDKELAEDLIDPEKKYQNADEVIMELEGEEEME